MYGDGYAIHLSSGLPELEARQKALDPALRAGLITAAVTYAGGPRGVEAFFRQAEGRELVKRTLWERGRAFGYHFKAEGLEESTDTFLQALNEMISHNPGKPLEEVMKETWDSFWIGGALGGTMGVMRGGGGGGQQQSEGAVTTTPAPVNSANGTAITNAIAGTGPDADIWKPRIGGGEYGDTGSDADASQQSDGSANLSFFDRFQSAKLKEVWSKLKPITNGPALHFGNSDAPSALMKAVEESLAKQPDKVQTPDGRTVLIKHNKDGGTIERLYEHLSTQDDGRPDRMRAAYASRISHTLEHAAVRLWDERHKSNVYIARYADRNGKKNAHFVIVKPDGTVADQGPVDLLKTAWARLDRGEQHLGSYGEMEALQFSRQQRNATPFTASNGRGATEDASNIFGQSHRNSGYTVWVNPNSGLTQRQGEEFVASLLGQRSSAVRADAAEVRAALERVRVEEPELLDDEMVVIAANPKELAASGRGYDKLTEAQLETLGLSEGVHDTETGKSIIFTDQIELRPGETPRQAVTRVIEHERIGHEGVNFMIRTDPEFKTKWEALSKQIPSDQLQGLLENGYHDLADKPHALALEWLAQQVDKYKAAKTPAEKAQAMPGVARQLWQAVKDWIAKRRSRGGDVSKLNFDNEVRELLGRAHEAVTSGRTREDAKARSAEAPGRTRPDFIKLADSNNSNTLSHGQETPEIRDPRRALEAQRGSAGRGGARSNEEGARIQRTESSGQSDTEGYRLPRIDEGSLEEGLRNLEEFGETEHDVYHDPASRRAVKLTKPGKTGAKGSLEDYLQRLAWSNEVFADDITVEGIVQLSGESGVRVVTTQPWHTPDKETPHPEQGEIDQYMRDRGFLRAYDGAYIHESRDIVATDALPKNFVEDRNGILHPIDVILTEPGSEQHERLTNMARSQTQLEKMTETENRFQQATPPPKPDLPMGLQPLERGHATIQDLLGRGGGDNSPSQQYFKSVLKAKSDLKDKTRNATKDAKKLAQQEFVAQHYDKPPLSKGLPKTPKEYLRSRIKGDPANRVFLVMPSGTGQNLIPSIFATRMAEDFGGQVYQGKSLMQREELLDKDGKPLPQAASKSLEGYTSKVGLPPFVMAKGQTREYWAEKLKGKQIILVDDIVTTGEGIEAVQLFLSSLDPEVELHDVAALAVNDNASFTTSPEITALESTLREQLKSSSVAPELEPYLRDSGALRQLIIDVHRESRPALLKRAREQATTPELAKLVLEKIHERRKMLHKASTKP